MVPANEREILEQLLKKLRKPELRALCKRYGLSGYWPKRRDDLIKELLQHTDQLAKGFEAKPGVGEQFASLEQGQSEIQAGQAELKRLVLDERQALVAFFETKIQVGWRERQLHSMGSWASLVGLVITLVALAWPEPRELYQLTIRVLDDDGSHAADATVLALPWHPIAEKDHWLVTIPVEEIPADGLLSVSASKNEGNAEEQVRLAQYRAFSVTLRLRYPTFIGGIVLSPAGEPAAGVQVTVFGYEAERVLSAVDGSFSLPAHDISGELVRLTAKKGAWRRVGHYAPGAHHKIQLIDRTGL